MSISDFRAKGIIDKSLPEIAEEVSQGKISSEALVRLYLDRISAMNRNGPRLQAVLTLNPDALSQARELDKIQATGEIKGALHGVPILLKDNIDSKDDMPTTAGALALKDLEVAGAILVDIKNHPAIPKGYWNMGYDLLKYEFKNGLNDYLASTSPEQVKTRTLEELIAFNQEHADVELALFDQSIFVASQALGSLESEEYKQAVKVVQRGSREEGVDKLLQEHNVVLLVAPSGHVAPRVDPVNGDVWPNRWPGYGSQTAAAGYPHATVPMGTVRALSVGLSFIGGKNTDADILAYAYAYEQQSKRLVAPQYLKRAEEIPAVAKAMRPYTGE